MAVAKEQFLSRGYQDTTFGSIAEAVSTSRGALYNRFPDKAALFGQVVETEINDMCARAALKISHHDDIRQSLIQQAVHIISVVTEPDHVGLYRIITREAPRTACVDDALRLAWTFFVSRLKTYLDQLVDEGQVEIADSRKAAEMFLGLVYQPVHIFLVYGFPEPTEGEMAEHIEKSVLLFLRGITLL